jgi:hypothetical protein
MPEEAQPTDPVLQEHAEQFAADVANLLNATVCDDAPITAVVQQGRVLVGAYDDRYAHIPIPLQVDRVRRLDLKIHHQCSWDLTGAFLAVEESSISVLPARERDPLVRFHYERNRGWAPAHLHVHAERDLIGFLLAGRDPSKSPTFRSLHLPVGGRRFRPSIEDVAESSSRNSVSRPNKGGANMWRDDASSGARSNLLRRSATFCGLIQTGYGATCTMSSTGPTRTSRDLGRRTRGVRPGA